MKFWTNTVTVYSNTGSGYEKTDTYEGCFWMRRAYFIYDGGHRLRRSEFICRIPERECGIMPGDIVALGNISTEIDDSEGEDFLAAHSGNAFKVASCSGTRFTKLEGLNP